MLWVILAALTAARGACQEARPELVDSPDRVEAARQYQDQAHRGGGSPPPAAAAPPVVPACPPPVAVPPSPPPPIPPEPARVAPVPVAEAECLVDEVVDQLHHGVVADDLPELLGVVDRRQVEPLDRVEGSSALVEERIVGKGHRQDEATFIDQRVARAIEHIAGGQQRRHRVQRSPGDAAAGRGPVPDAG